MPHVISGLGKKGKQTKKEGQSDGNSPKTRIYLSRATRKNPNGGQIVSYKGEEHKKKKNQKKKQTKNQKLGIGTCGPKAANKGAVTGGGQVNLLLTLPSCH